MPTPSQIRSGSFPSIPLAGDEVFHAEQDGVSVGVTFEEIAGYVRSTIPLEMDIFVPGEPTASQKVFRKTAIDAFTIPSGATDSVATADVASAGTVSFSLEVNGVSFGTITFTTGTTGSFTVATDTTFNPGDILTVIAPVSPDANLADIGITLIGFRA